MPRGRPRTKPVRTTPVRKYTRRGTEKGFFSKARVAERKAAAAAAREEKLNNEPFFGSLFTTKRKYTKRTPTHTKFDEFGNPIKRKRAKKATHTRFE